MISLSRLAIGKTEWLPREFSPINQLLPQERRAIFYLLLAISTRKQIWPRQCCQRNIQKGDFATHLQPDEAVLEQLLSLSRVNELQAPFDNFS